MKKNRVEQELEKLKRENRRLKKENKTMKRRSGFRAGAIAFGVTAALFGSIFPLFRIGDFVLCGVLASLVGKVVSIMSTGLDLTTHNRQDEKSRPAPVTELPLSGDEAADAVIARGQEMLHQIRAENAAIPDPTLSSQMDELERLCVQIFKTVADKPAKAGQIRKFMNYYLPTTLKMLASYRTMCDRGVSVSDLNETRSTTIRGMGMVLTACQKQLDNLYKDTMLDVSTDIDVLEQMLKRDGFTDSEMGAMSTARTAAAQQLRQPGAQPLQGAAQENDDDFVSFYSQKKQR